MAQEHVWRVGGYSDEEIARFRADAVQATAANQEQMAAMLAERQFNRGAGNEGASASMNAGDTTDLDRMA